MLYKSTEKKLQQIREEVDSITDRLDLPVDEGIKKAVVAFRLSGFPTSGSCQGHTDWGLPYPWIDIDCLDDDQDVSLNKNKEFLTNFKELLKVYNSSPNRNSEDIQIEHYGCFGEFRVKSTSLEKMNDFADYLVRRYDFCSPSPWPGDRIYMDEQSYKDIVKWSEECKQ